MPLILFDNAVSIRTGNIIARWEAGDIDAELIGIRSPLMMRIDATFQAKEMFCRTRIELVDRQRFRARKNVNAAQIG